MYFPTTVRQQDFITCFGVDYKEVLGISTCNPVSQLLVSAGVRVLGLDLNDRYILGGVFHDSWIIDRLRGEGGVVIHILHFNVDFDGSVEWDDTMISSIHRQPVGFGCLPVENICCVDNSCRKNSKQKISGIGSMEHHIYFDLAVVQKRVQHITNALLSEKIKSHVR